MSGEDDLIHLKKIWYQRLKDDGFKDIETFQGFLKDWPAQRIRRDFTPEKIQEKQEYFRAASELYWEHTFDSSLEKKIWQLHCEGNSYREIAYTLKTPENKVNKDNVQIVITKLSKLAYKMVMNAED